MIDESDVDALVAMIQAQGRTIIDLRERLERAADDVGRLAVRVAELQARGATPRGEESQ